MSEKHFSIIPGIKLEKMLLFRCNKEMHKTLKSLAAAKKCTTHSLVRQMIEHCLGELAEKETEPRLSYTRHSPRQDELTETEK